MGGKDETFQSIRPSRTSSVDGKAVDILIGSYFNREKGKAH